MMSFKHYNVVRMANQLVKKEEIPKVVTLGSKSLPRANVKAETYDSNSMTPKEFLKKFPGYRFIFADEFTERSD